MENKLILIVAFVVFFILLSTTSFVIINMFNKLFFKYNTRTIINFVMIFNVSYLVFYFISIIIGNNFFMGLHRILNYYFGFLIIGLSIAVIFWIVYFGLNIFQKEQILVSKEIGIVISLIFLFVNSLAIYNFEKGIKVEKFLIGSDKVSKDYSFVQIGDIQYGTVSKKYMENVMKLAIKQKPDFIVFVGDLIDFEKYKLEDFNIFDDIKMPFYFVNGNHEYYHDHKRLLSYLQQKQSVVTLMNDKAIFDNEIEIVGIDYNTSSFKLRDNLKNIKLMKNKFSILLYHEPKGIKYGVEKGFDLMLFGHTHGGQLFPITKLINFIYKYGNGFYQEGSTKIYTTDGAGLWGPKMRLGSQNEIVVFNLQPKKAH